MKKLLLILALCFYPCLCQALTAHVEYTYPALDKNYVVVWVSETTPINESNQRFGQRDLEKDGIVDIGGIVPGKTYYFGIRAYSDIDDTPSPWGNELAVTAPTNIKPNPKPLPEIPAIEAPGWKIESITLRPE